MTDAYGSLAFFSYFFCQSFVDSGVIPPVVVKTRGLNEDFSMGHFTSADPGHATHPLRFL